MTGDAALEALLRSVPWSGLLHAYGRATDTPDHLRALARPEAEGRKAALQHLGSAILHQGTPWTATPPVAQTVAHLLAQPALDVGSERPVRLPLLGFLTGVAEVVPASGLAREELLEMAGACDLAPWLATGDDEALYEDETASNALYARSILGCIELAPLLWRVMCAGLSDADARIRVQAVHGATVLVSAGAVAAAAVDELAERLAGWVDPQAGLACDERSAHVCSLATLGRVPPALLADTDPAVRLCAALAPQFAGTQVATEVLLACLDDPAAIDTWFGERPPHFRQLPRFRIVQALLERVSSFERLAPAAERIARLTTKYAVDAEWGPLLAAAFPPDRAPTAPLTPAQRRYLRALVDNAALWDPRFGNAIRWFQRAGLPCEREACARLLG